MERIHMLQYYNNCFAMSYELDTDLTFIVSYKGSVYPSGTAIIIFIFHNLHLYEEKTTQNLNR